MSRAVWPASAPLTSISDQISCPRPRAGVDQDDRLVAAQAGADVGDGAAPVRRRAAGVSSPGMRDDDRPAGAEAVGAVVVRRGDRDAGGVGRHRRAAQVEAAPGRGGAVRPGEEVVRPGQQAAGRAIGSHPGVDGPSARVLAATHADPSTRSAERRGGARRAGGAAGAQRHRDEQAAPAAAAQDASPGSGQAHGDRAGGRSTQVVLDGGPRASRAAPRPVSVAGRIRADSPTVAAPVVVTRIGSAPRARRLRWLEASTS